MITNQCMALFVTCCVWVKMEPVPPTNKRLTDLVLKGFPELLGDTWEYRVQVAPELASRICRASNGLRIQYSVHDPCTLFNHPKWASRLIAGIWYMTNDSPAEEQMFTTHVQSHFPNLNSLDIAVECSWICRHIMPDIYDWWFPLNRAVTPKKKVTLRSKSSSRGRVRFNGGRNA